MSTVTTIYYTHAGERADATTADSCVIIEYDENGTVVSEKFAVRDKPIHRIVLRYSPDQPRDETGKWTSGGNSGTQSPQADKSKAGTPRKTKLHLTATHPSGTASENVLKEAGKVEAQLRKLDEQSSICGQDMDYFSAQRIAIRQEEGKAGRYLADMTPEARGRIEELDRNSAEVMQRWDKLLQQRRDLKDSENERALRTLVANPNLKNRVSESISADFSPSEAEEVKGNLAWAQAFVEPELLRGIVSVERVAPGIRASCSDLQLSITGMDAISGDATVVHEFGHYLENTVPGLDRDARDYYNTRTQNEAPVKLNEFIPGSGYGVDEVTRPDKFLDAYTGKVYPRNTELVSMGLQHLYQNPVKFAREDPDHLNWLVSKLQPSRFGGKR